MTTSAGTRRDVRIRLESSWEGAGFDLATRAVSKYETDYRRMAQLHMRAEAEMAEATRRRAADAEAANKRQMLAMEGAGRVILGLSGATAAGLVLATNAAMDWESAWAGVRKTTDGSPEQMAALEAELRQLARTLPATHGEIAAVAEAAGQLGVRREDVADFTRVMLDLGETTDLSSDQAATAIAQLMNIMGTAGDQVDELGSTIVALGNAGASTESQILMMAQRIAGAGKLVGATEGEVLATASALASMGVSAELGGGVVSRVLQDIYSAVQTGGPQLQGFAQVAGMSAQQFATAWREDPIRALAAFADGLNGIESSGGNVITTLTDLGIRSAEEQRLLLNLKANADLLTDALDLQATAWEENNALQREAAERYATTEARLEMARGQINDAAIDIGGNFLPVVADAAQWVGQLADGFGALPDPAKSFITTVGAAATGLGLVVGGAAIAIPKLHELSTTINSLRGGNSLLGRGLGATAGLLSGPWGIALAAAAVGLSIFMQKQGEARQRVEALRSSLDEQTASITENTRSMVAENLAEMRGFWEGIWDAPVGASRMSALEGADVLGVDLQTLTDAALGNAAALDQVTAALDRARGLLADTGATSGMTTDEIHDLEGAIVAVDTGLQIQSNSLGTAIEKQQLINEATGQGTAELEANAEAAAAAAAEQEALEAANEELLAQFAESDAAFVDLLGGYQAIIDKNREVAQETADATEDASDSWQDYYDGFSVNLADYLAELDAQIAAQQAWETNMLLLAGRVSAGTLEELAKMGPEGAPLVAALVDSSEAELGRFESAVTEKVGDGTTAWASTLLAAQPILAAIGAQLGDATMQEAAAALASGEKTLQDVINDYSLQGVTFDVDADLTGADQAIREFQSRQRFLTIQARVTADPNYSPARTENFAPVRRSRGGPITGAGTETSDSILVAASHNEHMWSAAETHAAGGHAEVAKLRAAALAGHLNAMPTGAGAAPALTAAAGVGGGGRSVDIDINMDVPPGLPEAVAQLTADAVKTRLGDALAAAGVGTSPL